MALVNIKLHGALGKAVGKDVWNLAVKSAGEAINAINILTNNKLNKHLTKSGADKFHVLINGRKVQVGPDWNPDHPSIIDKVKNSELSLRLSNLQTIDIMPVIEFAGSDFLTVVLGALLIIAGVLVTIGTLGGGGLLGAALIIGGIGVLSAGVINLLSKPPASEDFREIQNGGKSSYLFSGPQNVINEGGPVPVGYGTLIVGSQVISASYQINNIPIDTNEGSLPAPAGLLMAINLAGNEYAYFKDDIDSIKLRYKGSTSSLVRYNDNSPFTITTNWPKSAPKDIYNSSIQSTNSDACNIEITLGEENSLRDVLFRLHFINYFNPTRQFRIYSDIDYDTMEANYPTNRLRDHLGNLTFDLDSYSIPQGGSYVYEKRANLSVNGKYAFKVNRDNGYGSFAFCAIEAYDYATVNNYD